MEINAKSLLVYLDTCKNNGLDYRLSMRALKSDIVCLLNDKAGNMSDAGFVLYQDANGQKKPEEKKVEKMTVNVRRWKSPMGDTHGTVTITKGTPIDVGNDWWKSGGSSMHNYVAIEILGCTMDQYYRMQQDGTVKIDIKDVKRKKDL